MTRARALRHVLDIIEAIEKIEGYTRGKDYRTFSEDPMLIDAIVRNLEVMGEAARGVPEEVRGANPAIPWRKMIGLRNILIHDYGSIDTANIWQIVTINAPGVKRAFLALAESLRK